MLKLEPYLRHSYHNEVIVEEFNFGQPREKVIDRAVYKSLEMPHNVRNFGKQCTFLVSSVYFSFFAT
jgi:hypothetical protein